MLKIDINFHFSHFKFNKIKILYNKYKKQKIIAKIYNQTQNNSIN